MTSHKHPTGGLEPKRDTLENSLEHREADSLLPPTRIVETNYMVLRPGNAYAVQPDGSVVPYEGPVYQLNGVRRGVRY